MLCFKCAILIVSTLMIVPCAMASPYLPVGDEAYDILHHLEAEGVIQSGLLTTKPLSHKEIARLVFEAERNSVDKSLFIQRLVKTLKERFEDEIGDAKYIKPIDLFYGRYIYADSDIQALYYNNDGDHYEKGSNLRSGFSSRAELEWVSVYINPEVRYSDSDTDLVMKRGYGVLSFLGAGLALGKDSQWWGPGYHGSILLSNNTEPMTMLRLTNSQPVLLPWIFKYLGPFRFTFFATRLEKERNDFPEPYLWGMRFNFKPHPYLEIGLQRTALLGGKGRSEDLGTWLKSLTGKGENVPGVEAGDQKAGFDIKLTLPFKWQPLQVYAEAAGEDEAGGLPYKWAYLTGIYLPRILSLERISMRGEYATTHVEGSPNVWYTHGIYTDGYKYKGRIIGHHMGTDSKDIFLEVSYLIPERNGRISIFYDREEHNLSGTVREKKDEVDVRVDIKLAKDLKVKTSYGYGKIKNIGNIPAEDRKINIIIGMISYNF
ncbi:MAG: capsule assembly Wzi family protein [Nitrospirota bacterium]